MHDAGQVAAYLGFNRAWDPGLPGVGISQPSHLVVFLDFTASSTFGGHHGWC